MTKALKRLAVLAILLAAAVAYILIARRQLDYPWLYLDLRAIRLGNVLFLGAALLTFALAAVFAAYLLFNADGPVRRLILPFAAFLVLILLSGIFFGRGVEGIPCTYTEELSAAEEFYAAERYQNGSTRFAPQRIAGRISGYVYYENEDAKGEKVTVRSLSAKQFDNEQRRLASLGLESFTEDDLICYTFRTPLVVWQIVVDKDEQTVSYCRFDHPEDIPDYMPRPAEPEPEPPRPTHSAPAASGGA